MQVIVIPNLNFGAVFERHCGSFPCYYTDISILGNVTSYSNIRIIIALIKYFFQHFNISHVLSDIGLDGSLILELKDAAHFIHQLDAAIVY